jgi:anti-sigma B factor antagonist
MEGLTVTAEQFGKVTVAKCAGFIDSQTALIVESAITGLIEEKKYKIVIDLSKVDYVSSAGWGIFVGYVRDLRKFGGDLKFSNMKNEVREIFELLDFTNILEYFGDVESAVKAFNSAK